MLIKVHQQRSRYQSLKDPELKQPEHVYFHFYQEGEPHRWKTICVSDTHELFWFLWIQTKNRMKQLACFCAAVIKTHLLWHHNKVKHTQT